MAQIIPGPLYKIDTHLFKMKNKHFKHIIGLRIYKFIIYQREKYITLAEI